MTTPTQAPSSGRSSPPSLGTGGLSLLCASPWSEYSLLDSGDGRKLERFGPYVLDRPEPDALWRRALPASVWAGAQARFELADSGGEWRVRGALPDRWQMRYQPLELSFTAALRPFRHTGVFPEQSAHWDWLAERVGRAGGQPHILVLFGYTALATLALARAGARVTHVDASRPAMTWARQNAIDSGLSSRPIRWLIEDALKFVRREARRGVRYDGIVLDPPAFGRGPEGEVWRFATGLPALFDAARDVLEPDPLLALVNAYAIPGSPIMLANLLADLLPGAAAITAGELALEGGGRILPTGMFARWSAV